MTAAVAEWHSRPLEPLYPMVFFGATRVKVRNQGTVCNKAIYLALGEVAKGSACAAGGKADEGITPDGHKYILRPWIDPNEGAQFWLRIVNELRNRGVKDILIAVVDGLNGFSKAITAPSNPPPTIPPAKPVES